MMYRYEYDYAYEQYAVYRPDGSLVSYVFDEFDASKFVNRENARIARENEKKDTNMGENEKRVRQHIELAGFKTRTVRMSTGWVGQISGGPANSVWDSEPFEEQDDALKAANDKLNEKLKTIFQ